MRRSSGADGPIQWQTVKSRGDERVSPLAETVEQVRRGNSDALAILYDQYANSLLRLATRILSSRADAEDVVHDLFVGLPEHLTHYIEIGGFGPWIRTLTIGLAHLHLRRDVRRGRLLADKSHVNALFGATREPGTAIDVERAVARLPDRLRVVFVLKQWEGYAHNEIATMLNITPGTCRVRHLRALRLLRALLEP